MGYFSLHLREASAGVYVDDNTLARSLIEQFVASGVQIQHSTSPASLPAFVVTSSLKNRTELPVSLWSKAHVHAIRYAKLAEADACFVSGPPVSVTAVRGQRIHVIRCEEYAPIDHLHRMLKYPLRAQLEAAGYAMVHAAGVTNSAGSGILFLGPSGSGKTTLFLELTGIGMSGLGSDGILLTPDGDQVVAVPWPSHLRIGLDTVRANPILREFFSPDESWPSNQRIECYCDSIDRAFDRRVIGNCARVHAILDLKFDLESDTLALTLLDPDAAQTVVADRVVADRTFTGWLPGWRWEEDGQVIRELSETLVRSARVFRLELGVKAPEWPERLRDILEQLGSTDGAVPLTRSGNSDHRLAENQRNVPV